LRYNRGKCKLLPLKYLNFMCISRQAGRLFFIMTIDAPIRRLLELAPSGLTDGQLLWRLKAGGVRYDSSELLEALELLARTGQVISRNGRWHAPREKSSTTEGGIIARPPLSTGLAGDRLRAAPATLATVAPSERAWQSDLEPNSAPHPAALLRYYAATQRRDPRGSVEAYRDQHGTKWHLFDANGPWWDGRTATIQAGLLEPGFRQALAEAGGTGSAAVGWPIGVFRDASGVRCLPLLLLPVDWRLEGDRLTFSADTVQPALNPASVRLIRRLTGLREDALLSALDPGEEDAGLLSAGRRLMHLLARIGGGGLAPGALATEMSLAGEGLRNAAALFLPDEASFTRRLAQDIDRLSDWPAERLAATALPGFLPLEGLPGPSRLADPFELSALTERQFAAADAALSGRPVAIQGPPGTGKSEVIVGLIVSALAAGKTVLFAARNHRALDEVEARLARILPDSQLLVRTRDADGERDTGFFEALSGLTDAVAATPDQTAAAADRRRILTEAAARSAAQRRVESERTRLHLALGDLLERAAALSEARYAAGLTAGRSRMSCGFVRLVDWLRRLTGRLPDQLTPLPANARLDEIAGRIMALRKELARLPAPQDPPAFDPVQHLAALAGAISAPDADALQHLRARKAEIEFQPGRARQQHLTAEDARHVLRCRPVWLSSTLSVPARIPLMPGLFDLAIFDEASQCDVASALAVMARARSAVIVGDPEQLSFIPALGKEQEHALMDAAGLPRSGRAIWAQSQNSLFDLARHRLPADALHLLPDQFRSAPDIVDYTSEVFYGGRLRARRADDQFRSPRDFRPGLHWQDVRGPSGREDGGNVNRAEAEWIARRIAALVRRSGRR
jgi:hypothetical protein